MPVEMGEWRDATDLVSASRDTLGHIAKRLPVLPIVSIHMVVIIVRGLAFVSMDSMESCVTKRIVRFPAAMVVFVDPMEGAIVPLATIPLTVSVFPVQKVVPLMPGGLAVTAMGHVYALPVITDDTVPRGNALNPVEMEEYVTTREYAFAPPHMPDFSVKLIYALTVHPTIQLMVAISEILQSPQVPAAAHLVPVLHHPPSIYV